MTYSSKISVIAGLAAALAAATPALSAQWDQIRLNVPGGEVTAVQVVGGRTFVMAARQWMEVTACAEHRICFTPRRPNGAKKAPAGGLPDGMVATADSGDLVQAWYGAPTPQYGHGILGDRTEAGELVAVAKGGKQYRIKAPDGGVFEDLTPRLADLDGDGRNEVITIASGAGAGASVAIYGLSGGDLVQVAATPPIGLTHRWRNPSVIADLDGKSGLEIAEVVTPHIGGTLRIWSYSGPGKLREIANATGFSNHSIGSRELGLAAAMDIDGDGRKELAVPSANGQTLRIVNVSGETLSEKASVAMPASIDKAIGAVSDPDGQAPGAFIVAPRGGSLYAVAPQAAQFYCIRNRADERLLFIGGYKDGTRRERLTASGEDWCLPRAGLSVVWTFTDADALEGCSRLVESEHGLVLSAFSAFDNCAWSREN